MVRSILEPDLLLRIILKKKQQLGEIERDLKNLPLDHPGRLRLFERRLHLEEGIPVLEAEYANRTAVPSKAVAVAANLAKKSPEDAQHASADDKNRSPLPITEDYRVINFKGKRYDLPPQRALIVKALDDARMSGAGDLSTKQIQKLAHCGKISQSFRTGDGPKLWKHLVAPVKNCRGMYKLTLPCPPAQ